MGIHKLMQLLNDQAPNSIRKLDISYFQGRTVAVDASMSMYQFLIATQGQQDGFLQTLTDKEGNKTGHLLGLFLRTCAMLENQIKPIWVFDGKPPTLKSGELAKRKKAKQEAAEQVTKALEEGNMEEALKFQQRTTFITKEMKEDAMTMLKLMGIPIIQAPCEAEAQCAALTLQDLAYATVTDDMDALTLRTKVLLKSFNNKKEPIIEINFDKMIQELQMTYDEFVDLCILCGSDFTPTIEGIGPVTAFKLIKEFKTIENVLQHLQQLNEEGSRKKPYVIPQPYNYEDARRLFKEPEVLSKENFDITFNFKNIDEKSLREFLVDKKQFGDNRIESFLKKVKEFDKKGSQTRLENFFKVGTSKQSSTAQKPKKAIQTQKKK